MTTAKIRIDIDGGEGRNSTYWEGRLSLALVRRVLTVLMRNGRASAGQCLTFVDSWPRMGRVIVEQVWPNGRRQVRIRREDIDRMAQQHWQERLEADPHEALAPLINRAVDCGLFATIELVVDSLTRKVGEGTFVSAADCVALSVRCAEAEAARGKQ